MSSSCSVSLLGKLKGPYRPAPWQPIDTVAVGNYLAREFGGGGGSELKNLAFLRYLEAELTKSGDKQPRPTPQRDLQRRPLDQRPDRADHGARHRSSNRRGRGDCALGPLGGDLASDGAPLAALAR